MAMAAARRASHPGNMDRLAVTALATIAPGLASHRAFVAAGRRRVAELRRFVTIVDAEVGRGVAAAAARILDRVEKDLSTAGTDGLRPGSGHSGVDAAELQLLRVVPLEHFHRALSNVEHRIRTYLPPHDANRREFERLRSRDNVFGQPAALRDAAIRALSAANGYRRERVESLARSVRGVVAVAVLAAAAVVALVAANVAHPGSMPGCFTVAAGRVCATGSEPGRFDALVVASLGILGAAVTTFWSALTQPTGITTRRALSALKLSAGAIIAVGGQALIAKGFIPGLSALDTQTQVLAWAFLMGTAQHIATAHIDRRIHALNHESSAWADPILDLSHLTGDKAMTDEPAEGGPQLPDDPVPGQQASGSARTARIVVILIVTLLAVTPAAVATDSWVLVLSFAGIALSALALTTSAVPIGPTALAWPAVTRSLAALLPGTVATVLGWTVLWVGVVAVLNRSGPTAPGLPGTLLAAAFGAALGCGVAGVSGRAFRTAAASVAGGRKDSVTAMTRRCTVLIAVGMASVTVLVAWNALARDDLTWTAVLLMVVILLGSLPSYLVLTRTARGRRVEKAEFAEHLISIRSSLEDYGFNISEPRANSPMVGSVLDSVDFLVSEQRQSLVVQFHAAGPGDQADWSAASELLIAADAIDHADPDGPNPVRPVMVLIGSEPDSSLCRLAEERSVHLLRVPSGGAEQVEQIRTGLRNLLQSPTGDVTPKQR